MAEEFRLTKKQAGRPASKDEPVTQEDKSSLLAAAGKTLGGTALSGLHTLGSIQSWPSRLLHGGINAAVGGKEGFGENYLNPFDSTGGVQGSRHLINAGILAENDPEKWEWGDFWRGLADTGGDPTTFTTGFGLTKAGLNAAKLAKVGEVGGLAAGRVAQHAAGQRALLTIGLPWKGPALELGVGPGAAKIAENIGKFSGLTKIRDVAKASKIGRLARAGFDYTVQGISHPWVQKHVPSGVSNWLKSLRGADAEVTRLARSDLADHSSEALRYAKERTAPAAVGKWQNNPHAANGAYEEMVPFHASPQKVAGEFGDRTPTSPRTSHIDMSNATAPMVHFDANGVLRTGGNATKHAEHAAEAAFKEHHAALRTQLDATPTHIPGESHMAQILRAIHEHIPGAANSEMVQMDDLRRLLPHINKADMDKAVFELSRREIAMPHGHDFPFGQTPAQIESMADFGQHIPELLQPGYLNGRYKIGFGLRRGHAPLSAEDAITHIPNPARAQAEQAIQNLNVNKAAFTANHAAETLQNLHAAHGADDALHTIAHMANLKEGGMRMMVPKSQLNEFKKRFEMGGKRVIESDLSRHPEMQNWRKVAQQQLDDNRHWGTGNEDYLADVVDHSHRHTTITPENEVAAMSRGSTVMPAKSPIDKGRKELFKGHYEGTNGYNNAAGSPLYHEAGRTGGKDAIVAALREHEGHKWIEGYQTDDMLARVAATGRRVEHTAKKIDEYSKQLDNLSQITEPLRANGITTGAAFRQAERREGSLTARALKWEEKHASAVAAHEKALAKRASRFKDMAEHILAHPELERVNQNTPLLFGNHPLVDLKSSLVSAAKAPAMAPVVYRTISEHMNEGDKQVPLGEFLAAKGYNPTTAAEHIAGKTFDDPDELAAFLKDTTLDTKLADSLKSLTPKYTVPEATSEAAKMFKSGTAWWKGLTLAFPASRVRDAVSGTIQNLLHGWTDRRFLLHDTKALMEGRIITRDYSHVKAIKEWLAKSGKQWSPENQTEALRQLVAVHLPSEHNMLGDVVPITKGAAGEGMPISTGATLQQLTHNVPGKTRDTMLNQFVTEPLKTLLGRGHDGATWTGAPRQAGESLLSRAKRAVLHPFTGVRGVGEQATTTFAPVKASEGVSGWSDAYNRAGPFMQMIHNGYSPEVAADLVNKAQVLYDPHTFTATERAIKNYVLPFYSFSSRMIPETARQLSNFGSPTSQLVKGLDRASGGGDPSVPDYVMAGTGMPLATADDGTKKYATGAGLMHEPAVSLLGLLAGGNLGAAGYDTLAQLHPAWANPLQRITGQSFFQRGTPLRDLDPTTGRLLSNIGETTGMLPEGSRPIVFPGSKAIDMAIGGTPIGRLASQARTMADPRKGILSKLADTMSGARITDISPEKQLATLQKRAEDLARAEGAYEQRTVGFPKEQLAELALRNPELAKRQQHLQNMLTTIKRKKTATRKENKAKAEAAKLTKKD